MHLMLVLVLMEPDLNQNCPDTENMSLCLPSKLRRTDVAKTEAVIVVSMRRKVGELAKKEDNIDDTEVDVIFRGVATGYLLRFHKLESTK